MLSRARAESGLGLEAPASAEAIRNQAIDAEVTRRFEEAERQAELDEVSARLGRRSGSPHHPAHVPPPIWQPTEASAQIDATPSAMQASTRATILLVMTPGDRGIRRYNPSADPILCIADTCWISRGLVENARPVRRAKAFGPINTISQRAGACNDSTRCVFRNVDLGAHQAVVQPVDLRLMRHDRREARPVTIDHTCRSTGRTLQCAEAQAGADYVMWIVPEAVASDVGSDALERFVATGRLAPDRRIAGGQRPQ